MSESFSKAHGNREPRHPHGVDGDSPEYFSHNSPSSTDASRRERQGDGKCTGLDDQRYFSNFTQKGVAKPTNGSRLVERDAEGYPAFSENLSSAAHEGADRIRRRER